MLCWFWLQCSRTLRYIVRRKKQFITEHTKHSKSALYSFNLESRYRWMLNTTPIPASTQPLGTGAGWTTQPACRFRWKQNAVHCQNQTLTPQASGLVSYWAILPPVCEYFKMPHECPAHRLIHLTFTCQHNVTTYKQSGPKKCIHSLLINIFGINLNDISISGWECNIMFSQQIAQGLL